MMKIFKIQNLVEAEHLADQLAQEFPNPTAASLGLLELFINAIEHGHLNIHHDKQKYIANGTWHHEIKNRLVLPENYNKFVHIKFSKTPRLIKIEIQDQGSGFEWNRYLSVNPKNIRQYHKRGIVISKMLSFDEMIYMGSGNHVVCRVHL